MIKITYDALLYLSSGFKHEPTVGNITCPVHSDDSDSPFSLASLPDIQSSTPALLW